MEVIEDMEDAGQLTPSDALAARDIASLAKAHGEGVVPYARVQERLEKSTSNVITLFKAHGLNLRLDPITHQPSTKQTAR